MTGSGARLMGARPRKAWRPSPTESGSMVPSFHSGNPAVDQPPRQAGVDGAAQSPLRWFRRHHPS